jgi:predicted alpha/beta superfamily hydrolase
MIEEFSPWQHYPAQSNSHTHTVVGNLKIGAGVYSPQLNNQRDILVYLPPSYAHSNERYPVLYMHDGQNLFDRATSFVDEWGVDETMEVLSREGHESIIVGIPNMGLERCNEYSPFEDGHRGGGCGEKYLQFLVQTLKPRIDHDFRTRTDRQHTGIMGSSMGGLISLYGFLRHPHIFGFAGVMSPSLWFANRAIFEYVAAAPFVPGKLYLDMGTMEGPAMLADARRMCRLLMHKGYRADQYIQYVEDQGAGHTETAWAQRFGPALQWLLPPHRHSAVQAPAWILPSTSAARIMT